MWEWPAASTQFVPTIQFIATPLVSLQATRRWVPAGQRAPTTVCPPRPPRTLRVSPEHPQDVVGQRAAGGIKTILCTFSGRGLQVNKRVWGGVSSIHCLCWFCQLSFILFKETFFSSVILLVFGCAGSFLLRGLSLAVGARSWSLAEVHGFSQQWFLLLQSTGSR